MIGLIDYDLFFKFKYPNLEIMKLFSYFKKQRKNIELITNIDQIDHYAHIFFRQENSNYEFPTHIINDIRTQWGGKAFSPHYEPMKSTIEYIVPDSSIYYDYLISSIYAGAIKPSILTHVKKTNYARIINNGMLYDPNFETKLDANKPYLVIYDDNFFSYNEWFRIFDSIKDYSIQLVYPGIITELQDATNILLSNNFKHKNNKIVFRLPLNDKKIIVKELFPHFDNTVGNNCYMEFGYDALGKDDFLIKLFNLLDVVFKGYSLGYTIKMCPAKTLPSDLYSFAMYIFKFSTIHFYRSNSLLDIIPKKHKDLLLYGAKLNGDKGYKIISTPIDKIKREVWTLG